MKEIFFHNLFKSMDAHREEQESSASSAQSTTMHTAIQRHMQGYAVAENMNGFKRMQMCRHALEALDRLSPIIHLFAFFSRPYDDAWKKEGMESLLPPAPVSRGVPQELHPRLLQAGWPGLL